MAKELKKGSIIKRLCAYAIDYLIIVLVVSIISSPFTDVNKTEKASNEMTKIVEKYQSGEITADEYIQNYTDIYYSLSRTTGVMNFITILIDILYFVVLQFFMKGQTIGKKLLKIKIKSDVGNLSMNQLIFRSFIANVILLNIINFGLMIFASKYVYMGVSVSLSMIQYIIMFISIILATTKEGRTIHDRIAHTRVVVAK